MKSVDMLAFGVALALGLAVAQTPREMAIALGVASAYLLAKLLMTGPSSDVPAYGSDDGPLTPKQIAAIRKDAATTLPNGNVLLREDLFP